MGIDLKTYGLNGVKILATYDGYINFLSQKDKGYGKSIHLYSPELGITTKYAHLFSFLGEQVELEYLRLALSLVCGSAEFQFLLPQERFSVKKSRWIALTGESGTGGPHLHLEFRDPTGYINPLYFDSFRTDDLYFPTITSLVWEDSLSGSDLEIELEESPNGVYRLQERISAKGKIRIKVRGYDRIRSQNKNNVYAFELRKGNETIYRKEFSYIPYSDGAKRYLFYDTNRSSLIPPVYYYTFFDTDLGYSIDLSHYSEGTEMDLLAILEDASGKQSKLFIPIRISSDLPAKPASETFSQFSGLYLSKDGNLRLDLKNNPVSGGGSLLLEATDWKSEGIELPSGLKATSLTYKVATRNFNWKGRAPGNLYLNRAPEKSEHLYFYDLSSRRFQSIPQNKIRNGFHFMLEKFGILGVVRDESPPTVGYVYQLDERVHLPIALDSNLIERYYYLSDIGSGVTESPEVYLEGEPYPYEYDRDKKAIRVLFPKKAFYHKKFLLLEIRPRDHAGNVGSFFTEILSL